MRRFTRSVSRGDNGGVNRSQYSEPNSMGDAMTNQEAREKFQQLRSDAGPVDTATLDELFAVLEPIDCESMFGDWKIGDFKTGHRGSLMLAAMKWHGKTFNSRLDVKPLMCLDEKGKLYSSRGDEGRGQPVDGRIPRQAVGLHGVRRATRL